VKTKHREINKNHQHKEKGCQPSKRLIALFLILLPLLFQFPIEIVIIVEYKRLFVHTKEKLKANSLE
ncbi:hypothetical protein ACH0BF_11425, partial [Pseudobacillus sp. 179-B 2D1 NHS]|uniref:hypothetical protein n=1 Tax=Pseudobacillus sp. 179-B 2D1 NHS TaxID=3374292 RepID=UPI00387A834F